MWGAIVAEEIGKIRKYGAIYKTCPRQNLA
jgi:hypothetical protein